MLCAWRQLDLPDVTGPTLSLRPLSAKSADYRPNLTSLAASLIIILLRKMGATGFDRGRNVRRDACRSVSVGTVIKSQGNTTANSNELALAA